MRRAMQAMAAGVVVAGAAVAAGQGTVAYPNGDPLHIWVGNPDAAQAREEREIEVIRKLEAGITTLELYRWTE